MPLRPLHRLLNLRTELQEFDVFGIDGQPQAQGLLRLWKPFTSHVHQGRDVAVPDLLFDFWRGGLGTAEAQAHAVAVIERVIPKPVRRLDRAFRRDP